MSIDLSGFYVGMPHEILKNSYVGASFKHVGGKAVAQGMGVDIANGQHDAFAKTQPHAASGKEKDLVAQPVGCGKQLVQLLNGQDIRDRLKYAT